MHVLYVHQNFPAQFGHIAHHLVDKIGWKCSFVSQTPSGVVGGINKIEYKLAGGATKQNHFCSRTFENTVWHCDGVYRAMKLPRHSPKPAETGARARAAAVRRARKLERKRLERDGGR